MTTKSEIQRMCIGFRSEFGNVLIKLAAEKQLTLSHAATSTNSDIVETTVTNALVAEINKRAVDAGFTVERLDQAVTAILLAGEVLQHLSVIHQPIANTPSPACATFLNQVMYPGGLSLEKTL